MINNQVQQIVKKCKRVKPDAVWFGNDKCKRVKPDAVWFSDDKCKRIKPDAGSG